MAVHQDLRSMVNNPSMSDVTFMVEGRAVYAHRLLCVRSAYFKAMFEGSMKESKLERIQIPNVSYR